MPDDEHAHLLQRLEAERQRPVPPPPPGACDSGPTAQLMRLQRERRTRPGNGKKGNRP